VGTIDHTEFERGQERESVHVVDFADPNNCVGEHNNIEPN
jgi:hypothetical protein